MLLTNMRTIMRLFMVLILFFSLSCQAHKQHASEVCGRDTVFTLSISTSFHGEVFFNLCEVEENKIIYIMKRRILIDQGFKKTTETIIRENIKLTDKEFTYITDLYKKALKYNTLDNIIGLDGSYWCLESGRKSPYTKGCFWSPTDSKKRGLSGLYELGRYLWDFTGLANDKNFKFY